MLRRRPTEIDSILTSDFRENILDSLEETLLCGIVMRRYPFPLQYSPYSLGNVEMRRIGRKIEYIEPSFIPLLEIRLYLLALMYGSIVHDQHRRSGYGHGEPIHEFNEFVGIYGFRCGKSVIIAIAVNHSEYVEPSILKRGYDAFLSRKNPAIRNISFRANMAFVSVVKIDMIEFPQFFKLVQQLLTIIVVLRRGLTLRAFPYTPKSCANADKKFRRVPGQTFLPMLFSNAALALATLCRCFAMASFTAGSSDFCRMRFLPRPESVKRPSSPFSWKRFTHDMTLWCVCPARAPASLLLLPSALAKTMRHLIRKQWDFPSRYPFVRESLWESVISIFVACLDIICFYKTQQTNDMPHYVN